MKHISVIIYSLLLVFFLLSCALLKPSPHNKMLSDMKTLTYPMTIDQLDQKVREGIKKSFSLTDSKMIVLDNTANTKHASELRQYTPKVNQSWHQYFIYQGEEYLSKNDHIDIDSGSADSELSKYSKLGKERIIELESTDEMIQFVQNQYIFTIEEVKPGISRLKITGLSKLVYDESAPSSCGTASDSTDPGKSVSVKSSDSCLVDLDKSLQFQKRLYVKELEFLYYIDEDKALKLEKQYR